MPLTPEQKAANDRLHEAVVDMIGTVGNGMEDGLVTDWVIVAAQEKFDDEGDRVTSYNMVYRDGSLPTHITTGLLRCGLDLISGGWSKVEDGGD